MTNKLLLSIDPSTVSTGWAIFEGTKLADYGLIKENSKNVLQRIFIIKEQILTILTEYNINHIIIENVNITLSAKTAKALLGLQVILEMIAFENNISYSTVRPTHWRKILGLSNSPKLKRTEKKQEAINYVIEKYNISADSADDICDAICIGECYLKEEKNITEGECYEKSE